MAGKFYRLSDSDYNETYYNEISYIRTRSNRTTKLTPEQSAFSKVLHNICYKHNCITYVINSPA